jgi:hypothetical protein
MAKRDYEVGYGKPPTHTRFKPGASGNVAGRPKGAKNFATILARALDAPVVVTENGKRKQISKREAIVTQLVNKSASADLRAIQVLMDVMQKAEGKADIPLHTAEFEEADIKLIEGLRARMENPQGENGDADTTEG